MNLVEVKTKDLESIVPVYLNTDFIMLPGYGVYRSDRKSFRYYLKSETQKNEAGEMIDKVFIAPSITSVIKNAEPLQFGLLKWYADNGMEYCKNFLEHSANYGTFMHVCFADILKGKTFQLNEDFLKLEMISFYEKEGYDFNSGWKWYKDNFRDMRKDIFGFVSFCKDCNIKPLAIEFTVFNENEIYAGTADLICKMTLKTKVRGKDEYTEEEVLAIVDWKTGENTYPSHAIQLEGLKQAWNSMFPEMQIQKVFNYNCKNFRMPLGKTVIPYSLKDQTDNEYAFLWDHYIKIFHKQHPAEEAMFSDFLDIEIGYDIPIPDKFQDEKSIFAEVLEGLQIDNKETLF